MLTRITLILALLLTASVCANALTLKQKASLFQHDMEARFLLNGQALCKLKLPTESREFVAYNMPDNAYMTGIYLGTLSMKYAATGAAADRAAARESLEALHLLCAVSGEPGLLARAAWPKDKPMDDDGIWRDSACGNYRWRGDVSTDQVAGVMYGFTLAYDLIANDDEKERIAQDVTAMVEHVMANDMRIVDVDGEPTQWGRYDPAYVSGLERMNALLWLQALKVAAHVSADERYDALYRKWATEHDYAEIAVNARLDLNPSFRGAVNHSDDVLLYLGYLPLLMYETDMDIRGYIAQSARRSWEGDRFPGVKPEGNPFYAFIIARYLEDASGVEDAINTLRWFPLDAKWNHDTVAAYEEQFEFTFDPTPQSPEPEPNMPVPVDRRIKDWSAWVQDPYHSAGSRDEDNPMEFNGHDYLLGYWMGRYYGFIDDAQ